MPHPLFKQNSPETHVLSRKHLLDGGKSEVFNCGYGHGYSVRQVMEEARRITGVDINVQEAERRADAPPVLVADSSKMKQKLNWTPKCDSLELIIQTAWEWEQKQ